MVNVNPDTGIHYGIISIDSLYPEWWAEVAWNGTDVSYREAFLEAFPELAALKDADWPPGAESDVAEWNDDWWTDEPVYEGTTNGVKWRVTYLGGAALLWIFESPHVTRARTCSPCVPNAGDLNNLDPKHGVKTYTVPEDWLFTEQDL